MSEGGSKVAADVAKNSAKMPVRTIIILCSTALPIVILCGLLLFGALKKPKQKQSPVAGGEGNSFGTTNTTENKAENKNANEANTQGNTQENVQKSNISNETPKTNLETINEQKKQENSTGRN